MAFKLLAHLSINPPTIFFFELFNSKCSTKFSILLPMFQISQLRNSISNIQHFPTFLKLFNWLWLYSLIANNQLFPPFLLIKILTSPYFLSLLIFSPFIIFLIILSIFKYLNYTVSYLPFFVEWFSNKPFR